MDWQFDTAFAELKKQSRLVRQGFIRVMVSAYLDYQRDPHASKYMSGVLQVLRRLDTEQRQGAERALEVLQADMATWRRKRIAKGTYLNHVADTFNRDHKLCVAWKLEYSNLCGRY